MPGLPLRAPFSRPPPFSAWPPSWAPFLLSLLPFRLLYPGPATRRGCPKPFGEMWALPGESDWRGLDGLSHWVLASCSGCVPALTRPFPPGCHPGPPPNQRRPLDGTLPLANSQWPAPHWPLGARHSRSPFTLSFHNHATAVTRCGIRAFGPCHSHSPPPASFPVSTRSIGHPFTDGPPRLRGVLGFFPIPTPAGTRVVWIKGTVTASFALDGPVVPSTSLSQFCRHIVDRHPPLVTTPLASLHCSTAKAFTTLQPSPPWCSPPSPPCRCTAPIRSPRGCANPLPIAHAGRHFPETTNGRRSRSKGTPWDKRDPILSCRNPT